jgi:ferredoxin-NADP reductase
VFGLKYSQEQSRLRGLSQEFHVRRSADPEIGEHQTADTRRKNAAFVLPTDRTISVRPGQFLTFSFLFDGRKVVRSYSICSSAARLGYVEITPKRMTPGCVSVFLNDRATVGMTVEAAGPFGHFAWMNAGTTTSCYWRLEAGSRQ